MTEKQLRKFMGHLVEFQDRFNGLPTEVAQWAIQHTAVAIEAMCPALCAAYKKSQQTVAPVPKPPLLQLVSTVVVPAMSAQDKASNLFKEDVSANARVKIRYVDVGFTKWFGKMVVGAHAGSTLSFSTLMRNAYDREIHAVLGGADKCVTMLSELWWLMNQQPNGVGEVLLADGRANIFYILDGSSALRAVYVYWYASGWYVFASGLDCNYWDERRRVFVPASRVGACSSM